MMYKRVVILFASALIFALFSMVTQAGIYVSAHTGASFGIESHSYILDAGNNRDDLKDAYNPTATIYGFGAGWAFNTKWLQKALIHQFRLGIDASWRSNRRMRGDYHTAGEATPSAYFEMNVKSQRTFLVAEADLFNFKHFHPFLSVGVGQARNTTGPLGVGNNGKAITSNLHGDTNTYVAYLVGLGLGYQFNRYWNLYASYHYVNAGYVKPNTFINETGGFVSSAPEFKFCTNEFNLGLRFYV